MEAPPLLVRVLGGNVVTAAAVLACLNTTNATVLRRLHPALAAAVSDVPWADTDTRVCDATLWRVALPAATTLALAANALSPLHRGRTLAALGGVAVLHLTAACEHVTDDVIARLPPTLLTLNVSECRLIQHANFTHLHALEWLDCSSTKAVANGFARLPPSLRELRMNSCDVPDTADFSHLRNLRVVTRTMVQRPFSAATAASLPPSLEVLDIEDGLGGHWTHAWPGGWSAAHLPRLRVLKASCTGINDAAIATLPLCLKELDLESCDRLSSASSFAHLLGLTTLDLSRTPISNATLATLPPSLVSLNLCVAWKLTTDAVFPRLPALRVLYVSHTGIGDAAIASLPAGLEELHIVYCRQVTPRASLDHLAALQELQSADTDLSRATVVACRTRGCWAPADGTLEHTDGLEEFDSMAFLPDGRLVSGTTGGYVTLWETAVGRNAVLAELKLRSARVNALVVLPDGHRVAAGTRYGIHVWDTRKAPPTKDKQATIACGSGVQALAAARNGHLVAGCEDGTLRMVDVDAAAVVAVLEGHKTEVTVVAALLDGRVASAALEGCCVQLSDAATGTCTSSLIGHTDVITSLVVLADGRLASGSCDKTVRLWSTASDTCIRVLTGHMKMVYSLVVLPEDRLASLAADSTIRVWNTRDDAGALARPPLVIGATEATLQVLAALPGNRLAAGGINVVHLWQLPPPDVDA